MYINAVAKSVMLQLYFWHNFWNIIFKIKHILHMASDLALPPAMKNSGCT